MKLIIIFLTTFLSAFPMKKGDFATIDIYDNSQIEWGKKFRIVEVGGLYDSKIIKKLKKLNNVKLGYDWLPAFYFYTDGENKKFIENLYKNRNKFTLNPEGPFLHCKRYNYFWCKEFYFNFGDKEVIQKKINYLIKNLKEKQFCGIFFDWASGSYILEKEYKPIYQQFKKLNPNKNYFKMISEIYKTLKEKQIFFVTNQAFRQHKYLLPYIQYDMTESYITGIKYIKKRVMIKGKGVLEKIAVTDYYPIKNNSLKATLFYIDLLTKYKQKYKRYGFKNFIYLNYLAPEYKKIYQIPPLYREITPKNGIYFAFAMAKLTDNIVYSEVSNNKKLEKDPIYFYDLGEVKGENYQQLEEGIYIRFYQNGFVLVSNSFQKKFIKLDLKREFYDLYNKKWIKNGVIPLDYHIDTITNRKVPLGRVFLYER